MIAGETGKKFLMGLLNDRVNIGPGVGVVATYPDGVKTYAFHEDTETMDGIDHAAPYYAKLIDDGTIKRAEYIYKNSKSVHFWDWNEKSGSFCASDEYRSFCKAENLRFYADYLFRPIAIINGLTYKLDYTGAVDGISAITIERVETNKPNY